MESAKPVRFAWGWMPHQLELRPAVRTDSEDLSTRAVSFHKELSFFDFILQKICRNDEVSDAQISRSLMT